MCQYLFAAATMKKEYEELTHPDRRFHQAELIKGWKASLLRVAREEMQHLTYANNLLVSVGGSPYFVRPNFPNENRFYQKGPEDHGLLMSLEPFSLETVERFIRFETSEVEKSLDGLAAAIPDPNYYETLHELYTAIRAAFSDEMVVDINGQYDPTQEFEDSVRLQGRPRTANTVADATKLER